MPGTGGVPGDAVTLRAENARFPMLAEGKDAQIAALKTQNAELAERVARLERLISRNSPVPPGTDDLPGNKPPERNARRGGGRRPGKQPGAPGAYLAWRERPDETEDVFPEGSCGCGADLAGAADLGVRYSHQVTDLPEAQAQTTWYDRHEVRCVCGRVHLADVPPRAGAPGTVTYGLNVRAWCVFLMVMHHVPVERCADILASMSGTRPSDGWMYTLPGHAARAVAAANKTIRALIILAGVICGDETPLRAGPGPKIRKKYLQVACTNLLTCYFLGDRDLASFKAFVHSDLHGTVVVHDRYQNYDAFDGISHQLCCQHYCVILKTPPSPTRTRSGPARSQRPCAGSSTRPTWPAVRACTPCRPRRPRST
jgi:transposase